MQQSYRQRPRILVHDRAFIFPSQVTIDLQLAPADLFGVGDHTTREMFAGSKATYVANPDTGAVAVSATNPVAAPLEAVTPDFEIHGNVVRIPLECASHQQLVEALKKTVTLMPLLLSAQMAVPVMVTAVRGAVGDVAFSWVHRVSESVSEAVTTPQAQLVRLESAVTALGSIEWDRRPALRAALHYFHVAGCLAGLSRTPGEFLSEVFLNLAKTLQALFSDDRDEVAGYLRALGFDESRIRWHFLQVMVLRSQFDVAHVMLPQVFDEEAIVRLSERRHAIHDSFGELLLRVVEATWNGEDCYNERRPSSSEKRRLLEKAATPELEGEDAGFTGDRTRPRAWNLM